VPAASLQSIKKEFGASDFQLGMLTGLPVAIFYSFLGIPIAAWADRSSRRNVLAMSVALWSAMTALCGMAVNFTMLFASRIGTAIGEAGGTPPSHSSDRGLFSEEPPRDLSPRLTVALPSFVGLMFMAAVFFGPSFAMTQALATVRMRSVATSLLLFIQTLIGNGLGPSVAGKISDWLKPSLQTDSLRYALVIIGVVNLWAALHYWAQLEDGSRASGVDRTARARVTC
jgi:MFS family permease